MSRCGIERGNSHDRAPVLWLVPPAAGEHQGLRPRRGSPARHWPPALPAPPPPPSEGGGWRPGAPPRGAARRHDRAGRPPRRAAARHLSGVRPAVAPARPPQPTLAHPAPPRPPLPDLIFVGHTYKLDTLIAIVAHPSAPDVAA